MSKDEMIKKIKSLIKEWGSFQIGEVQTDCSPCFNSLNSKVVQLAESFNKNGIEAVTYAHDEPVDYESFDYEDLSDELLVEILDIVEQWAISEEKLFDSCKDENF